MGAALYADQQEYYVNGQRSSWRTFKKARHARRFIIERNEYPQYRGIKKDTWSRPAFRTGR